MAGFIGFFGSQVTVGIVSSIVQTVSSGGSPVDADALPIFKIYSSSGPMPNGTGTCSYIEEPAISGATIATPVVITSANHGLLTGMQIKVENVGDGTLGAVVNGVKTVTKIDANTFSLNATVGAGTYTASTGKWHRLGLYKWQLTLNPGDGYSAGNTYTMVADGTIGGSVVTGNDSFHYVG